MTPANLDIECLKPDHLCYLKINLKFTLHEVDQRCLKRQFRVQITTYPGHRGVNFDMTAIGFLGNRYYNLFLKKLTKLSNNLIAE